MYNMNNTHIFSDSRLDNRDYGVVKAEYEIIEWEEFFINGVKQRVEKTKTVIVEMIPIHCPNCGKEIGYAPKTMTTVSFLCRKCYTTWGKQVGNMVSPEEEFNQAVAEEMIAKFGKHLSDGEITVLKDRGELGKELSLLEKESPYIS